MDATALAARLLEPIPANVTCGIEVVRAAEGAAVAALEPPEALAPSDVVDDEREFDGVVPLGSAARIEFLRRKRLR
jgi:hypothetical protein